MRLQLRQQLPDGINDVSLFGSEKKRTIPIKAEIQHARVEHIQPVSKSLRASVGLAQLSGRALARASARNAQVVRDERALSQRGVPSSSADRRSVMRRSAAGRGRVRRAVRPRTSDIAASVRARARRLARPRSGDDRPGPDLRKGRLMLAMASCRTTAGGAGVCFNAAAARGARFLGEMAHILTRSSRHLFSVRARMPVCLARCWSWPARKSSRSQRPPTIHSIRAGRAGGVRRLFNKGQARLGSRSRFTSSANPRRSKEHFHERCLRLSVSGLSIRLLRRVHRRQPDPL